MSKELYFTPSMEDLHVGYKCRVTKGWQKLGDDQWTSIERDVEITAAGFPAIPGMMKMYDGIKTKYLDKEDIESLGWIEEPNIHLSINSWWKLGNYMLIKHEKCSHWDKVDGKYTEIIEGPQYIIWISDVTKIGIAERVLRDVCYMGPIKSINELKTLMHFLQIKS